MERQSKVTQHGRKASRRIKEEPLTQFEFQKLLLEPEIAVILSGKHCRLKSIRFSVGMPQERAWMSSLWSTAWT